MVNLQHFVDFSGDLFCVANQEGYLTWFNSRWQEVLGYTPEELQGKPYIEFIEPDDRKRSEKEIAKLFSEQGYRSISFENRALHKTKGTIWLSWNARVVDGFIYAVARDVTVSKQETYHFERTQQAARLGYWRLELNPPRPFWSPMTYEIHGVPVGEEIDLSQVLQFYSEESIPRITQAVDQAIRNGAAYDLELEIITRQGKRKWIRTICDPEVQEGKVLALHGTLQDIDRQKKSELNQRKLFQDIAKYKLVVDSLSIVATTDRNGVITSVNDKFCEIYGYSRKELIGKTHKLINSGFHSKVFFKNMWETIRSGKQWRGLIRNKKKNGEIYFVNTSITPILNDKGEVVEYMAIREDVTEKVCLEEKLESQKLKLVKSSRLASLGEMAGGIAHEINNPLGIISVGNLFLRKNIKDASEQVTETLDIIDRTVKRIASIVKGLRSFARQGEQDFSECSIQDVLDTTLSFCSEKFKVNGIQLDLDVKKAGTVLANSTQLSQVLLNLLNNAFSAVSDSNEKRVSITVSGNEEQIEVRVEDSGQGVSPEIQEHIFEPFFTTKPIGEGVGLGLSISHEICKAHQGELRYETSEKGGAVFVVLLPRVVSKKMEQVA